MGIISVNTFPLLLFPLHSLTSYSSPSSYFTSFISIPLPSLSPPNLYSTPFFMSYFNSRFQWFVTAPDILLEHWACQSKEIFHFHMFTKVNNSKDIIILKYLHPNTFLYTYLFYDPCCKIVLREQYVGIINYRY